MKYTKRIVALSVFGLFSIGAAHADIASQSYVTSQVGTLEQLTTEAKDNTVAAINEVKTTADAAKGTAEAANTAAGTAQSAAEAAQSAATAAQGTADTAKSDVDDLKEKLGSILDGSDGSLNITADDVSGLGALAKKNKVADADVEDNAAIKQSKIEGLTAALAGKANTSDIPTDLNELSNENTKFQSESEVQQAITSALSEAQLQGKLTAGDGIDITDNTVKVDNGDGLEIANGKVKVKAGTGITVNTNGVSVEFSQLGENEDFQAAISGALNSEQDDLKSAVDGAVADAISSGTETSDALKDKIKAGTNISIDSADGNLTISATDTKYTGTGAIKVEGTTISAENATTSTAGVVTLGSVADSDNGVVTGGAVKTAIDSAVGDVESALEGYEKTLTAGDGVSLTGADGRTVAVKAKSGGNITVDEEGISVTSGAFIPVPTDTCSSSSDGCVLTFKNGGYVWEAISR